LPYPASFITVRMSLSTAATLGAIAGITLGSFGVQMSWQRGPTLKYARRQSTTSGTKPTSLAPIVSRTVVTRCVRITARSCSACGASPYSGFPPRRTFSVLAPEQARVTTVGLPASVARRSWLRVERWQKFPRWSVPGSYAPADSPDIRLSPSATTAGGSFAARGAG
jgi:hypothetical protein